ncbi:MAG: VIT1/CCC1 transporter family protein [Halobacteriota archaeon]|jgi:predicted membrane protein (TIGR00267 family)
MSFNIEEGRYLILGSVDGLLATLGIIVGVSVVSASNSIVVSAGFGGAIALALTNGLGSYLAESTIEHGKLVRTEKSLLRKLNNTYVASQSRKKIAKDAITHGGASFLASLVPLAPWIFSVGSVIASVALSLTTLVALGFYAGYISRQNYAISVVKMVGLGMLIVIAVQLLRLVHLV